MRVGSHKSFCQPLIDYHEAWAKQEKTLDDSHDSHGFVDLSCPTLASSYLGHGFLGALNFPPASLHRRPRFQSKNRVKK